MNSLNNANHFILSDRFGDDPNDLEMENLSNVIIRGIEEDLCGTQTEYTRG